MLTCFKLRSSSQFFSVRESGGSLPVTWADKSAAPAAAPLINLQLRHNVTLLWNKSKEMSFLKALDFCPVLWENKSAAAAVADQLAALQPCNMLLLTV